MLHNPHSHSIVLNKKTIFQFDIKLSWCFHLHVSFIRKDLPAHVFTDPSQSNIDQTEPMNQFWSIWSSAEDHRCCLATEQSQTNGINKNRKTTRAWVVLPWRRYARSTTLPEKYSHVNPYHLSSEKSASKQVDCQLVLIKQAPCFVNDVLTIRTKMISPILWNFIIWGKKPRNWIEKHIKVCWNNGVKLEDIQFSICNSSSSSD